MPWYMHESRQFKKTYVALEHQYKDDSNGILGFQIGDILTKRENTQDEGCNLRTGQCGHMNLSKLKEMVPISNHYPKMSD